MTTKSVSQISALHLAIAASGGVLIYAALQDMTPVEALKELTSGKTPSPIEIKTSSLTGGSNREYLRGEISSTGGGSSALASAAEKYLGVPYKYGGTSKSGLDCSGLVVLAFRDAYGVTPPRTTYGQEPWKELTKVSRSDLKSGDLVFWPGHVAIYVGGGKVIHAPKPGRVVTIVPIDEAGPTRNPSSYRRYKGSAPKSRMV
ncbi:C40 family peptidase [Streptomyces sp. ISBFB 2968]|uniref:C40 family peptidase n=1 Tax=Streptomyces sp. ISBFB 2968 TaxID=2903527 RepID=UPI002FDBD52C